VCGVLDDTLVFPNGVQRYGSADSYTTPAQIDAAVEGMSKRGGYAFKANTIEELIESLPVSATAKKNAYTSIERYNELAKKGCDEDFGKKASRMFALENPPYYASEVRPAMVLDALGGLDCDYEQRVYDDEQNIIPGLYTAGNCQGNRYLIDKPIVFPGLSHSTCMTFGRIAGDNAAREV
jgi:succinate dehydrogenase/fumarate reductase flavoprotein subunit